MLTAGGAVSISVYDNEAGERIDQRRGELDPRDLPELGGSAPQVLAGEVIISA